MKIGVFMNYLSPRLGANEADFDCAIICAGEIIMKKLDQSWKSIQGSMALEGHYISDEALLEVANEYEASGDEELIKQAVLISEEKGGCFYDIFKQLRTERDKK